MKAAIKAFSPAALAILMIMPVSQVSATDATAGSRLSSSSRLSSISRLTVKTSVAEVIGVREIESGKFEQGIRKSKAALTKTSNMSLRKPFLDNLCVAHLAINNMEQATQYCKAAVNTVKASAISYNNRAVMHYVLGNVQASLDDLDAASQHRRFQNMVASNLKIVEQQNILNNNSGLMIEKESSFVSNSIL